MPDYSLSENDYLYLPFPDDTLLWDEVNRHWRMYICGSRHILCYPGEGEELNWNADEFTLFVLAHGYPGPDIIADNQGKTLTTKALADKLDTEIKVPKDLKRIVMWSCFAGVKTGGIAMSLWLELKARGYRTQVCGCPFATSPPVDGFLYVLDKGSRIRCNEQMHLVCYPEQAMRRRSVFQPGVGDASRRRASI